MRRYECTDVPLFEGHPGEFVVLGTAPAARERDGRHTCARARPVAFSSFVFRGGGRRMIGEYGGEIAKRTLQISHAHLGATIRRGL